MNLKMDKGGGFTDLFVFIIVAFAIGIIVVVFLYIGATATSQLHTSMDNLTIGNANVSQTIDNTMGKTNLAYQTLKWTSVLMIFAMIIGIFIGSYMVTTKPVFLIPYIFLVIIAIIVSVGMANGYHELMQNTTMASTFATTNAMNWLLLNLPIVVTVVGLAGGLIMFSRLGKGEEQYGGYYGG